MMTHSAKETRQQKESTGALGSWLKFEKGGVSKIGSLHKIGGLVTICQLWHKYDFMCISEIYFDSLH